MTNNQKITKQSLHDFQFVPKKEGSYGIDTNFNIYFIHILSKSKTSISKIKSGPVVRVAELNNSYAFTTFESDFSNKTIAMMASTSDSIPSIKMEKLNKVLEEQWK